MALFCLPHPEQRHIELFSISSVARCILWLFLHSKVPQTGNSTFWAITRFVAWVHWVITALYLYALVLGAFFYDHPSFPSVFGVKISHVNVRRAFTCPLELFNFNWRVWIHHRFINFGSQHSKLKRAIFIQKDLSLSSSVDKGFTEKREIKCKIVLLIEFSFSSTGTYNGII